jgi:hypothetical protein
MIKAVSLLAGFSWFIIALMVSINPSSTIPSSLPGEWGILFITFTTLFTLILTVWHQKITEKHMFFIYFPLSFILILAMGWMSALFVHRDFFSWPAQLVMIYYTIFLWRIDYLGIIKRKVQIYRALYQVAIVVFILWISWVMLMSWAIVVRSEPRWIESTFYNFCNGLIGLVMIYTAGILRDRVKQRIRLSGDAIYLDERNVSQLLSPQENSLIGVFLEAPHQSKNCRSLLEALNSTGELRESQAVGTGVLSGAEDCPEEKSKSSSIMPQTDCPTCHQEGWTATKCSAYRNLKNRIADAKKYLELLQIGTIVPVSENPRDIKEKGWRLRLFDDVRLEDKRR